jgi:hypothetical protein
LQGLGVVGSIRAFHDPLEEIVLDLEVQVHAVGIAGVGYHAADGGMVFRWSARRAGDEGVVVDVDPRGVGVVAPGVADPQGGGLEPRRTVLSVGFLANIDVVVEDLPVGSVHVRDALLAVQENSPAAAVSRAAVGGNRVAEDLEVMHAVNQDAIAIGGHRIGLDRVVADHQSVGGVGEDADLRRAQELVVGDRDSAAGVAQVDHRADHRHPVEHVVRCAAEDGIGDRYPAGIREIDRAGVDPRA